MRLRETTVLGVGVTGDRLWKQMIVLEIDDTVHM